MSDELQRVSPRKFMESVERGRKRLANFRAARLHFIQQYVGAYYDKSAGEVGTAAINLIFNAIRVILPNLVFNFPKHTVNTPYLQAREYAILQGLALEQHDLKINIRNAYRACITDALFTLGIIKTGLAQSQNIYAIDDAMQVDAGTVYSEHVDFDNFVIDPSSVEHMFEDARFRGDRLTVPRQLLLDSGLYQNDLVERLPRCGDDANRQRRSQSLSMNNIEMDSNYDLEDEVEICEIWVPSANAIVTVPGSDDVSFDDYLRVDDYYGVKEGPYTLLSFSPPVPGNPLPVPLVGVWYDLHVLANRMAKKVVQQAERQKDIVAYRRGASDDAEELQNAGDGDAIAVDDPDGVKTLSFGGQRNSNETHLAQLQMWFNLMASNPEQLGGQSSDAKSATAASILQQNAGVGLEDMKDQVYIFAASEARKRSWYFHTDPLINTPLTRRVLTSQPMPMMPWLMMPTMQEVQVVLTPEQRRGDFLDFTFTIEPESMSRKDSKLRLQQEMAFAQQVLPAAATAAQICMSMGIPFNFTAFVIRMAKDMGIEWLDEVLYDPQFQQQMAMQMQMQMQQSGDQGQKGQIAPMQQPNQGLGPAMMQNGQPGQVRGAPPTGQQQFNQQSQLGATDSQRMIKLAIGHAFAGGPQNPKPTLANAQGI